MWRKTLKSLTYVYWSNTFADPGERKKWVSGQVVLLPEGLLALRGLSWLGGPVDQVLTHSCASIQRALENDMFLGPTPKLFSKLPNLFNQLLNQTQLSVFWAQPVYHWHLEAQI